MSAKRLDLSKRKVFVTGADGFIGSHLVEELARRGCKVRALAYYNSFNSWGWLESLSPRVLKSVEVVSGDVRDAHAVRIAMKGCDVVMHLASLIAIPYSYHAPESYVDTNVKGTLNVLQAARELGVKKFVHTSTSEVYGTAKFVPITEDHPLQGQSPYSATKIAADQLAVSFHRSFGLPVATIRPFNTYGPRQSARAVIPTIITQIDAGKNKIELGATSPTRDFSYVKDIARAFVAVAESERTVGETINAGSGFEVSIGELAHLVAGLMRTKVRVVRSGERLRPAGSEVERLLADASKAKRLTGWTPEYGELEGFKRGLAETIRWFTHVENRAKYKAEICNI